MNRVTASGPNLHQARALLFKLRMMYDLDRTSSVKATELWRGERIFCVSKISDLLCEDLCEGQCDTLQ